MNLTKTLIVLSLFLILGVKIFGHDNFTPFSSAQISGAENLDGNFNPALGFAGRIMTSARQSDGKIVIAGIFSNVNGSSRANVARFFADGTLDDSFVPAITNDAVRSIAFQPDGKIVIAGYFTQIDGAVRNKIARLNQNGISFNVNSSHLSTISTLAIQSTGNILVGGNYLSFNGTVRIGLVRLLTNGSVDQSFISQTGGFSSTVNSAMWQGSIWRNSILTER